MFVLRPTESHSCVLWQMLINFKAGERYVTIPYNGLKHVHPRDICLNNVDDYVGK